MPPKLTKSRPKKPRNYIVRDMILTRKGGRMSDKRKAEGSRSLLKVDELDEVPNVPDEEITDED